ncbi:ABC transporter substrate-binding protein [Roseovarius pelagicus]|uniref:ABC transporter substrate-binding protein n=1 Tax=Roseovarius pelagicus TaxID=2980108 RepID=A0ABY6DCL8_9RHOB|nr:ABC transporter substrate-binding protein [Roseovarius pelagicus]UXX83892.1 ABC transporter substrate-binding protein [Roseovarius pelagicus]
MKRTFKTTLIAAALATASTFAAQAEALKLAHSTWVGYGPFYIAQAKGYFADEGVEIELSIMENTPLKMGALMAGRVDIVASTADEFPTYMREGKPLRYILAVDNSNGGDGVVSQKDIATVADLKGRSVAFEEGSVSQFFINALLHREGLSQDDIKMVNMTATDAGVAFAANRVDAAVTWEPHLSQGANMDHGKILVSSSDTPGLIVDVVAVLGTTAQEHEEELKGFVRAWQRALDFLETNPDEAYTIMADGVGGWLEDPEEFKAAATGIEYLSIDRNIEMFGTIETPGILTQTIDNAIAIWGELGRIKVDGLSAADLVDTSFLN